MTAVRPMTMSRRGAVCALWAGVLFLFSMAPAAAEVDAGDAAARMTFAEVLAAAEEAPLLELSRSELEAAEARRLTAETYPHNPTLELEGADRSGPEGSTTDYGVGVAQQLELAGQRGKRRAVAEAELRSDRGGLLRARQEVRAEAARAFAAAVAAREELEIESTEAELARSFTRLVEVRLEAGSATAVEAALARAGLARAERSLALAKGSYLRRQADLAEWVGRPEVLRVEPAGELPPFPELPTASEALAGALERRGDLAAARERVEAAAARVRLVEAGAGAVPDLTVRLHAGREEGADLVGMGLSVPLRIFNRDRGAVAEAEAELSAARAVLAVETFRVRRQVAAARARLEAAVEARRLAGEAGVAPLEEGLDLLERSFEAGKIGAAELLLYRRELVEGRRQAVAAEREAWEAAVELARVTGGAIPGAEWMGAEGMEDKSDDAESDDAGSDDARDDDAGDDDA